MTTPTDELQYPPTNTTNIRFTDQPAYMSGLEHIGDAIYKTDADVLKESCMIQANLTADNDRKFLESDNRASRNAAQINDNVVSQAAYQNADSRGNAHHLLTRMQAEFNATDDAIHKTDADVLKESCATQAHLIADNDRKFLESDNRAQRAADFTNAHLRETAWQDEQRSTRAADYTNSNIDKEGWRGETRARDNTTHILGDVRGETTNLGNNVNRNAAEIMGGIDGTNVNIDAEGWRNESRARDHTTHILGDLRGETSNLGNNVNRNTNELMSSIERTGRDNLVANERTGADATQATQRIANEIELSVERTGVAGALATERTASTITNGMQRIGAEEMQTTERSKTDIKGVLSDGFRAAVDNLGHHSRDTMNQYASTRANLEKIKAKVAKNVHHQSDRSDGHFERESHERHHDMDRLHDRFHDGHREQRDYVERQTDRFDAVQRVQHARLERLGERLDDNYRAQHHDMDHINDRFSDRFTTVDKDALHVERRSRTQASEYAAQSERGIDGLALQAAKNTGKLKAQMLKLELQAATNTAAIQLDASRTRCDILEKVCECCCEVKSTVVSQSDSVKSLLNSNENARLRDELAEARTQALIAQRGGGVSQSQGISENERFTIINRNVNTNEDEEDNHRRDRRSRSRSGSRG